MALNGDYMPKAHSWVESPEIDVGRYSDVRLQYRRWLGVEEGFFDKAKIYANDQQVWQNFDSGGDNSYHTTDREWVFRDLPLSTRIEDGTVALTFELISDGGLEMGGWTLDDLCIVADPNAICGDGTINGVEQCDDGSGNADEADACRINCRRARCGDSIVDTTEQCDDGNREDGDSCSDVCELPDDGGGCCSTGTDPTSALAPLAMVVGGLLFRRRRRRRTA
jgi:cysteine-rich repeat protein